MPNRICWDTDGTTFKVYSDGTLVFQTPLPAAGSTPTSIVAIDPTTGLPATAPAPPPYDLRLPDGAEPGDLLWWDGSTWQLLPVDGTPGHVLTEVTSGGGAVLPAWAAAAGADLGATPLQDACCGAARECGDKLRTGYEGLVHYIECAIDVLKGTGETSVSSAEETAMAGDVPDVLGDVAVAAEDADPAALLAGQIVQIVVAELVAALACFELAPLSPGAADVLDRCCFCALLATNSSLPLTWTPATSTAWQECITAHTADFTLAQAGGSVSLAGVTYTIPGLLQAVIAYFSTSSAAQWNRWAQFGARIPVRGWQAEPWTCPY